MANLIVPQQATNVDASVKSVHAGGKPASSKEAKSTAEAFDASLKEQVAKAEVANVAKKEALKKANPHAVIAQTQTPVPQIATPKNPKEDLEQAADGKTGGKKDEKVSITSTPGLALVQGAQAQGIQAQNLNALVNPKLANPKAEKNVKADVSDKVASAKASNLTPLQQMMLNEQMTAKSVAANPQTHAKGAVTGAEIPQMLQAMESQNSDLNHDFEVESLSVMPGAEKLLSLNEQAGEATKRTPVSKVSTNDFLDLRSLSKNNLQSPISQFGEKSGGLDLGTALKNKNGKKDQLESLTGREAFAGTLSSRLEPSHIKTIDAPVTQGTGGKNVLSHDAIHQMTGQVNQLSQARQDGEIKIRLRPDHLGELHMSVKTQGQQVSIEIKAQNGESKKIIEESIASLKESLGQQNLSLARIDVVNAPTHAQSAADQGMQMDMSQFRQNSGQGSGSDRGFDQGSNGRSDLYSEELNVPVNLSSRRAAGVNARAGSGLDLIA